MLLILMVQEPVSSGVHRLYGKSLHLPTQFCCEPKMALKNKIHLKKRKKNRVKASGSETHTDLSPQSPCGSWGNLPAFSPVLGKS